MEFGTSGGGEVTPLLHHQVSYVCVCNQKRNREFKYFHKRKYNTRQRETVEQKIAISCKHVAIPSLTVILLRK